MSVNTEAKVNDTQMKTELLKELHKFKWKLLLLFLSLSLLLEVVVVELLLLLFYFYPTFLSVLLLTVYLSGKLQSQFPA